MVKNFQYEIHTCILIVFRQIIRKTTYKLVKTIHLCIGIWYLLRPSWIFRQGNRTSTLYKNCLPFQKKTASDFGMLSTHKLNLADVDRQEDVSYLSPLVNCKVYPLPLLKVCPSSNSQNPSAFCTIPLLLPALSIFF